MDSINGIEKCKRPDSGTDLKTAEKSASGETCNTKEENKDTHEKVEDNVKTEHVKLENVFVPPELCRKIVRQLEYYFGDVNLPRDKFLQDKIREDEGWIKIETLLTFNRLKKMCEHFSWISFAVKNSKSEILEVSECLTKVRRSPSKPIPENTKERRTDIGSRTVYVKGFPLDCELDEIEAFFQAYGSIDSVSMRRMPKDKTFKGSVFVIFSSKNDTEKFLKLDGLKYKDSDECELKKMLKEDYFAMKQREKMELKNKEDSKTDNDDKLQEEKQKLMSRITKGAILHLEGLPNDTTREDIKNFFSDFCQVAWVDFDKGDKKARLRFDEENGAKLAVEKAQEANDGKIEINNAELVPRVLEGDEELEHWQNIFSKKNQGRNKKRTQPYNKGKRKFKQGGHGKKFHRDGEPQEKQSKKD